MSPAIWEGAHTITRIPRREPPQRIPAPVEGEPGLFVVDATWGLFSPMSLDPAVLTVGELEVIAHIQRGLPLADTRQPHFFAQGTIPGSVNIPHQEIVSRLGELDPEVPTVVFCNGPQCTATPQAVAALLAAGHPAEALLYYRGGIHDWVTLGLPLQRP